MLSFEESHALIELVTSKDIWDKITAIASLATAGAIFWGFWRHSKIERTVQILKKEVDILYSASDNFFTFTDALGALIFVKKTRYKSEVDGTKLADDYSEREDAKIKNIQDSYKFIYKSIYELKSIGDTDSAALIEEYANKSLEIVGEIKSASSTTASTPSVMVEYLSREKKIVDKLSDKCFAQISKKKDSLKS